MVDTDELVLLVRILRNGVGFTTALLDGRTAFRVDERESRQMEGCVCNCLLVGLGRHDDNRGPAAGLERRLCIELKKSQESLELKTRTVGDADAVKDRTQEPV